MILVPDDGFSTHDVSTVVGGLLPGRTYHFRLMAANSAGSGAGADMSFETPTLPISPGELMAPRIRFVGKDVDFTIEPSCAGRRYQLQRSDTMAPGTWVDEGTEVIGDGGTLAITIPRDPDMPRRFYRLALEPGPPGFALIPAGEFLMGDQSDPRVGPYWELPVRTVAVSAFYLGKNEVTDEEWNAVRSWGLTHGYTDLPAGDGKGHSEISSTYPPPRPHLGLGFSR